MQVDVEAEESELSGKEDETPSPHDVSPDSGDEVVDIDDDDDAPERRQSQRGSSDAASRPAVAASSPLPFSPADIIELDPSPSPPAPAAGLTLAAAVASSPSSDLVDAADERTVSIACWNCQHEQSCAASAVFIQCDMCSLPISNPNAAVASSSFSSSSSSLASSSSPAVSAAGSELHALLESCCVCDELLVSSPLCFLACGHILHEHHKYITLRASCAACCSTSSSSPTAYSAKDIAYRPSAAEAAHYRQKKESEKLRYGSERGPAFPLFLEPAEVARLLVYGEDGEGETSDRRSVEDRVTQLQREVAEAQAEQAAMQHEEQRLQEEKTSTDQQLQAVQNSVQRRQQRQEQRQQRTARLQRRTYQLHRSLRQMERDIQLLTEEMSRHAEEQKAVMKEDPVDWSDGDEEQQETAEEGEDTAAETIRTERRERRQRRQLRHAQLHTAGSEWAKQQRDRWQHMQKQLLRYRQGMRERQEAETEASSAEVQLTAAKRQQRQEQQELEQLEAELRREKQAWDRERKAEEKLQMQRDKKRKNECRTAAAPADSRDKAVEELRDLKAKGQKRRQAAQGAVKERTLQLLDGLLSPPLTPASLSTASRSSSSLPFQLSLPASSSSTTAKSSLRPVTASGSFPGSRFPSFQPLAVSSLVSSTSLAPIPGSGSFLRTGPDGRGGTVSVGRTGSGLSSVLLFPTAAVKGVAGTGAGRRAEQSITAFLQSARSQ